MKVSRRTLVRSVAAAGAVSMTSRTVAIAQEGTPAAIEASTPVEIAPGYQIVRVRKLSTEALNQAIYPHVMHRFLPLTETVPGYAGYIFAFHGDDPTASITTTLVADEAAAASANQTAVDYVSGLDPRFAPETPMAEQGPLRIFQITAKPASDLPPFLNGCQLTTRTQLGAPGLDYDVLIEELNAGLVPQLAEMEGFVLYSWMQIEGGAVASNIWETPEQLAVGNEAVAAWVSESAAETVAGPPVVNSGTIGYADFV